MEQKSQKGQAEFSGEIALSDKAREDLYRIFSGAEQRARALPLMLSGMTADKARQVLLEEDRDDTYTRKK